MINQAAASGSVTSQELGSETGFSRFWRFVHKEAVFIADDIVHGIDDFLRRAARVYCRY